MLRVNLGNSCTSSSVVCHSWAIVLKMASNFDSCPDKSIVPWRSQGQPTFAKVQTRSHCGSWQKILLDIINIIMPRLSHSVGQLANFGDVQTKRQVLFWALRQLEVDFLIMALNLFIL